mmetsp:Transcript_7052/g.11811  ORF Transcript_7052/g.11811 Transcript_7052/m.11811 type:complete len:223 (-) Transcript_7052:563-1231(-)
MAAARHRRASAAHGHLDVAAAVANCTHGAHDGSCARAKGLHEPALLLGLHQLRHAHPALVHLHGRVAEAAELLSQVRIGLAELEDGVARDARQHVSTVQGRGRQLQGRVLRSGLLQHEEDVHGAHFSDLVRVTIQPQHLRVTFLLSLGAHVNGGGVVTAHLHIAHSARPGAHIFLIRQERHGLGLGGVVGAHGGQDRVDLDLLRGMHAQEGGRADCGGANVQ